MGEIAEMIVEGTLCQECGEFITDDPPGHPQTCGGCEIYRLEDEAPTGRKGGE